MRTWLGRNWRNLVGGVAIVVGAILVVALIQVIYKVWVFHAFPNKMATRGQFGDLFGAVNAFFTGLAFAGIVFTIFLQRRELTFQREELQETTTLSVTAALVDSYASQIATIEQGKFRGKLWAANTEISWDEEEEVARPPENQQVMRDQIETKVKEYIQKPGSAKSEWVQW